MTGRFRPHSWRYKFGHAYRGLNRAVRTQHSFAVHFAIGCVVVLAAGLLQVTAIEWAVLAVTIGLVLVTETVNTAIESLSRAVNTGFHPRLRDALDIASAAVLLAAVAAVCVGLSIFGPRLLSLLFTC